MSRQFILFHNFLKAVKLAEMIQQGINNPSDKDVSRRLSTGELALHSQRVTYGRAETTRLTVGDVVFFIFQLLYDLFILHDRLY